jgi:hypothetical protein
VSYGVHLRESVLLRVGAEGVGCVRLMGDPETLAGRGGINLKSLSVEPAWAVERWQSGFSPEVELKDRSLWRRRQMKTERASRVGTEGIA